MVKVLTAVASVVLAASGCTTAPKPGDGDVAIVAPAAASVKNQGFVSVGDSEVLGAADGCVRSTAWSDGLPNCGEQSAQELGLTNIQEVPAVSQVQPEPLYVRETLNGSALFEVDSAELSPEGFQALDELVGRIGEVAGAGSIEIVGHTDDTGSQEYNQKLSAKRAQQVQEFLQGKISGLSITSSAQGELSPVADNSTEEGRAKNRRVEVLVNRSKIAR